MRSLSPIAPAARFAQTPSNGTALDVHMIRKLPFARLARVGAKSRPSEVGEASAAPEGVEPIERICSVRTPPLLRRVFPVLRFMATPEGRRRLRLSAFSRIPSIPWGLAIAYRHTAARRARLIAVVGSYGKTTTAQALSVALGAPRLTDDDWNAGTALADAILHASPHARPAVIESSISEPGQMARYARLIRPSMVVVTSIGTEHWASLKTLDATREEKAAMLRALPSRGLAILNGDDVQVLRMRSASPSPILTCGLGPDNDVRATELVDDELSGLRFRLHLAGETYDVRTRLLGRHMAYPVLAAAAASWAEGRDVRRSLDALQFLNPAWNRLRPVPHRSGATLILDAYKSALETMVAALETLERLPARRRIAVLGDVEEPPGSQGPIYRQLGERVGRIADLVLFVGGKTNLQRLRVGTASAGLPRDAVALVHHDLRDAARVLERELRSGDLVLIKGRSTQHLERIALRLLDTPAQCAVPVCRRIYPCATCPFLAEGP